MATLTKGNQTIVVPDEAAESYEQDGWSLDGQAEPEPAPAVPKHRRPSRAKKPATKVTAPAVPDPEAGDS